MTNLNITLDRSLPQPLQQQLIAALKRNISNDALPTDLRLPSSRALALELGVSRIVTVTAYDQLIAEGYLVTRQGAGTYINPDIIHHSHPLRHPQEDYPGPTWFHPQTPFSAPRDGEISFALGRPSAQYFDTIAWKRSWRRALTLPFANDAPPPQGVFELRDALARLVARTRGIHCSPEDIIITSGAVDIITLMARITAPFQPVTCLENPGFPAARQIFQRYGHKIQPIPVDRDGLILRDLPQLPGRAKILFCTPSHQFPLGFRLSLPRRLALMDWARLQDAILLEDDYDSEFRYDVAPLPSLKAQDETGHVIYFSSLSKSLSPAIGIGYMIAPAKIRAAVTRDMEQNHMQPPWLLQQAMAHFIQTGELDKHIRRMRRHYMTLNKAMRKGLDALPDDINIHGLDAGLHCFIEFPDRLDPKTVCKRLEKQKVTVNHIAPYTIPPATWRGLALGYGHLTEQEILQGLEILSHSLN